MFAHIFLEGPYSVPCEIIQRVSVCVYACVCVCVCDASEIHNHVAVVQISTVNTTTSITDD